jgi:hypothetical protein
MALLDSCRTRADHTDLPVFISSIVSHLVFIMNLADDIQLFRVGLINTALLLHTNFTSYEARRDHSNRADIKGDVRGACRGYEADEQGTSDVQGHAGVRCAKRRLSKAELTEQLHCQPLAGTLYA